MGHPGQRFRPKEILETLLKHGVDYVVLGGVASTIHGSPLPTSDLDICPSLDHKNFERLAEALKELEARFMVTDEPRGRSMDWSGDLISKLLLGAEFVHLQTKHGQLDLIYRPAGTSGYKDLSRGATTKRLDGRLEVRVAALEDIIRSKQTAGRERDLQQLPTLRKLQEISQEGGGPE